MERQQWIESVRGELRRRRLPAAYIERLTAELADHAEDHERDLGAQGAELVEESALEQALGEPREVAQAALLKFRQTRFAGRHPFVVFALLPVPLAMAVMIAVFIVLAIPLEYFFHPLNHYVAAMETIRFACVLLPILLPAAWLCRVARRAAVGLPWRIVAFGMLALCAGALNGGVVSPTATVEGKVFIGIGFPVTLMQWLQLCIPLALLAWSLRRASRVTVAA